MSLSRLVQNLLPCPVAYVRISRKELYLRDLDSGRVWRELPAFAVMGPPIKPGVVSVGQAAVDAVALDPDRLMLVEDFRHPRTLVENFEAAQELLKSALDGLYGRRFFSPLLVMHPLEKLAGDLTQIEERALLELAEAAGGRRGCIWTGRQLVDEDLRSARQCWTPRLEV